MRVAAGSDYRTLRTTGPNRQDSRYRRSGARLAVCFGSRARAMRARCFEASGGVVVPCRCPRAARKARSPSAAHCGRSDRRTPNSKLQTPNPNTTKGRTLCRSKQRGIKAEAHLQGSRTQERPIHGHAPILRIRPSVSSVAGPAAYPGGCIALARRQALGL
jgi:hypothetical protein